MPDLLRRLALLAALVVALPASLDAQVRRGRQNAPPPEPWAPAVVGAQVGYDQTSRAELLGAHAFLPVLRSGVVQLHPVAEITFLNGGKDYKYLVDLVWMSGGRNGGVFLGGGIGRMASLIDSTPASPGRNTFTSYDIALGAVSQVAAARTALEVRWLFPQDVVADFRPVTFTLGVGFPLWGRSGRDG